MLNKYFIGVFWGNINCMTKMDIKSQGVNVYIVFICISYVYISRLFIISNPVDNENIF